MAENRREPLVGYAKEVFEGFAVFGRHDHVDDETGQAIDEG